MMSPPRTLDSKKQSLAAIASTNGPATRAMSMSTFSVVAGALAIA